MSRMAQETQRLVNEMGSRKPRGRRMDDTEPVTPVDEIEPDTDAPKVSEVSEVNGEEGAAMTTAKKATKRVRKPKVTAEKKATRKAAPKAAPKLKAVKPVREAKERSITSGLTAKPKSKVLFINRDGALMLVYKLLTQAEGLTANETYEADRLIARIKARQ